MAYFLIYFFPCLFCLALHVRKLLSHSFMTLLRHSWCCCCWRAAAVAAAVANVAVAVVVSSLWPVNFLSMSHTLFSQLVVSKSDKDTDTHTYAHTNTLTPTWRTYENCFWTVRALKNKKKGKENKGRKTVQLFCCSLLRLYNSFSCYYSYRRGNKSTIKTTRYCYGTKDTIRT